MPPSRLPRLGRAAPFAVMAALLGAGLAGCSAFDDTPPPACPRAAIIDEAKHATFYAEGAGRDLTDVAFEVGLTSLTGTCEYDIDEDNVSLESVLTVTLEARRGPAGVADEVEARYFVAIVDPEQRILAKQVFPTRLVFAESGIRAQKVEEVTQEFNVARGYFGADYEILLGLQLDREQFDQNLKRERR
ncbi:MAG: hypothetical protein AB7P52_13050 [Alphaproteobacteria bacterium]